MRSDDLTPRQTAQRSTLVATLEDAGWTDGGLPFNSQFDTGMYAVYEAGLKYRTPSGVVLVLHFNASRQTLHLSIEDPSWPVMGLVIEIGEDHQAVFRALVDAQDHLNGGNYRDALAGVIDRSPAVYAAVGHDGTDAVRLHNEPSPHQTDDG